MLCSVNKAKKAPSSAHRRLVSLSLDDATVRVWVVPKQITSTCIVQMGEAS